MSMIKFPPLRMKTGGNYDQCHTKMEQAKKDRRSFYRGFICIDYSVFGFYFINDFLKRILWLY